MKGYSYELVNFQELVAGDRTWHPSLLFLTAVAMVVIPPSSRSDQTCLDVEEA